MELVRIGTKFDIILLFLSFSVFTNSGNQCYTIYNCRDNEVFSYMIEVVAQ